jgi:phosphatidylethanolamine/phosphatidyl-N-methylethanolamine N-methyltransferase
VNNSGERDVEHFYKDDYFQVFANKKIQFLLKGIHKKLDKPLRYTKNLEILEVGAGHGQHFALTKLQTDRYVELDLREFKSLELEDSKSVENRRTRVVGDAKTLDEMKSNEFNGLIATCLLAHLSDMDSSLKNWRRVVKHDGFITIYVPCEPGIVLRFARFFTTKKLISNLGYDHACIHWAEHRNHFPGMQTAIKKAFNLDEITERKFPIRFLSWDFNFYAIFVIQIKK